MPVRREATAIGRPVAGSGWYATPQRKSVSSQQICGGRRAQRELDALAAVQAQAHGAGHLFEGSLR